MKQKQCPNCQQYKMENYKDFYRSVMAISFVAGIVLLPLIVILWPMAIIFFILSFFAKGRYCRHCKYGDMGPTKE